MQSISDVLNRFHEDGSWFARAHELRGWVLRCDANSRGPVVGLLPKLEFHHDNDRAWPLLADAHTHADSGWQVRATNLAVDWNRRVQAFAKAGVEQTSVEAVYVEGQRRSAGGLVAFRATAAAILRAMAPPLAGLVVIIAPTVVDDVGVLEAEMLELLGDAALDHCRYVLVLDHGVPLPNTLLEHLGLQRGLVTECVVDEDQQRRDLDAMLAESDGRFGMAWPVGVEVPLRVDDPPPLAKDQFEAALRAKGIEPALLEQAPYIRREVLAAAWAMKDGRGADAIALQREACRRCAMLGLAEFQVILQISLASYLSALGQREQAKREVREASELAGTHSLLRAQSQAQLALGLLHALDQDHERATAAYRDSARTAEAANEPQLAIEAWRMTGQLAAGRRHDRAAADGFGHALRVAGVTAPELVQASSAAEAARALAAVYERNQMWDQAASLHAQADAFDAGATQP